MTDENQNDADETQNTDADQANDAAQNEDNAASEGQDGQQKQDQENKEATSKQDDAADKDGEDKDGEDKEGGNKDEPYSVSAPEGLTITDNVMSTFNELANELELPEEGAQKIVDKIAPIISQNQEKQVEELKAGWLEQAQTDKEIGGDKLEANIAQAEKAQEQYFAPEFKAFLDKSGLGNHPEMIRGLMKVGATLSEDKIVNGGAPSGETDAADALFPNTKTEN